MAPGPWSVHRSSGWCCFAWLGNVVRADSGVLFAVLVAVTAVMAVMLVVLLTVPEVFSDRPGGLHAPLVFVLCYGAVRLLHPISYRIAHPDDRVPHATLRRTALLSVGPPFVLLLIGSTLSGVAQGGVGCLAAGAVVTVIPAPAALALPAAAVTAMVVLHGRSVRGPETGSEVVPNRS